MSTENLSPSDAHTLLTRVGIPSTSVSAKGDNFIVHFSSAIESEIMLEACAAISRQNKQTTSAKRKSDPMDGDPKNLKYLEISKKELGSCLDYLKEHELKTVVDIEKAKVAAAEEQQAMSPLWARRVMSEQHGRFKVTYTTEKEEKERMRDPVTGIQYLHELAQLGETVIVPERAGKNPNTLLGAKPRGSIGR